VATRVDKGCSKRKVVVTTARNKKKVEVMVKGTTKASGLQGPWRILLRN
jgi:hypothetical protein